MAAEWEATIQNDKPDGVLVKGDMFLASVAG